MVKVKVQWGHRARNCSSIHQQWSSKNCNISEPDSTPSAKIIACHTRASGIICTPQSREWHGRAEEQEVQWQIDKMWLYAIILRWFESEGSFSLNIQGQRQCWRMYSGTDRSTNDFFGMIFIHTSKLDRKTKAFTLFAHYTTKTPLLKVQPDEWWWNLSAAALWTHHQTEVYMKYNLVSCTQRWEPSPERWCDS